TCAAPAEHIKKHRDAGSLTGNQVMALSRISTVNNSDAALLLASGIRYLRFPEPLEAEFRSEHRTRLRRWNRLSFWIAACTVTGFAILDHFVLHGEPARI